MKYFKLSFLLIAASIIFSGCIPGAGVRRYDINNPNIDEYDSINSPVGSSGMDPAEVQEIIAGIEERNKTVEEDPEWIKRAYDGLMVRKLNNLSAKDYKNYRQYLDDGAVYVIVHPAFFPFFHYPENLPQIDGNSSLSKHNVVERLLNMKPRDEEFALLQAQERRMRDFLEFMSARKKLVVVVVPKGYERYKGYKYKGGKDEYTRYLNEVTNFSESVIFAESRSPNRGYLTDEDGIRLMEFLLSVNANTIYVGGGYVGRCLEDFYDLLTKEFGSEDIYLVPELSDVSPRELTPQIAKFMLTLEGNINHAIAEINIISDIYRIQEVKPQIKHLPGEAKAIELQYEELNKR